MRIGTSAPFDARTCTSKMSSSMHALRRLGLQDDLPGAAEFVEVVDVVAAERGLQRGEDVADADAQGLGALAVDVEPDQRRRGAVGGEDAGQRRVRVRRLHQPARDRRHLARRRARIGLQLVFEPGSGAETDDRRQVERDDDRRRQLQEIAHAAGRARPTRFGRSEVRSANGASVTKNVALFDWAMPSIIL